MQDFSGDIIDINYHEHEGKRIARVTLKTQSGVKFRKLWNHWANYLLGENAGVGTKIKAFGTEKGENFFPTNLEIQQEEKPKKQLTAIHESQTDENWQKIHFISDNIESPIVRKCFAQIHQQIKEGKFDLMSWPSVRDQLVERLHAARLETIPVSRIWEKESNEKTKLEAGQAHELVSIVKMQMGLQANASGGSGEINGSN